MISKFFKSQDLFGNGFQFMFNKQGSTHFTTVGGIFSVLIQIATILYFSILFRKMIYYEEDANSAIVQ